MIYRSEKGEPLTIEELDGNFRELAERVQKLENTIHEQHPMDGLKEIRQEGDRIHFISTMGHDLGFVTLPKIHPTMRGQWKENMYYCINDWVIEERRTYACTQSHVSTTFEKDQEKWQCITGE